MTPLCTAAMPCPDNSSLNINEFVGEGFAFLIGVLLAAFVYEWLQRRRERRRKSLAIWYNDDAIRGVSRNVYENKAPGGAQGYAKKPRHNR